LARSTSYEASHYAVFSNLENCGIQNKLYMLSSTVYSFGGILISGG
jgi:hypothetical protein